ncbi:MAG: chorismate mutase [Candidatus Bathyarchaeota archaeon]|nr:MAG: chorismate mutase [Candidatus Bathyarchaeota archaeon]
MERILASRKRIDEIDEKILHLLKERIEVCREIGVIKRQLKIPIRDSHREGEVHTNITRKASELGLNLQKVKVIYREVVAMSTHVQKHRKFEE